MRNTIFCVAYWWVAMAVASHLFFILFFYVFKKSIREHLKTKIITIVILCVKKREENVDVIILQHSHQILEPIPTTYRFFVRSFQILFVVD